LEGVAADTGQARKPAVPPVEAWVVELEEIHTVAADRDIPADVHDFGILSAEAGCSNGEVHDLYDNDVPVD
jgi:hypothetical protein